MSHPVDRRHRFLVSVKKGRRRASSLVTYKEKKERPDLVEKISRGLRETTKRCSCRMCGNPRKFLSEKTMQEKKYGELA